MWTMQGRKFGSVNLAVAWIRWLLFSTPAGLYLCYWVVGRVYICDQGNDYRFLGVLNGPFLERSVKRAAVRQGGRWPCGPSHILINDYELMDDISKYQLLKNDSATWTYFASTVVQNTYFMSQ